MIMPRPNIRFAALVPIALATLSCSSTEPSGAPGTLFCPSGGSGSFVTLNEGAAAPTAGGQIVVCDGEWPLDDQLIDRAITIRSQHPGGATISDADTSHVSQAGRPAIR